MIGNYSTQDLSDLSGLSLRRVDRYASAGCFGDSNRSPGSGGRRTFGQTDLYVACAIVALSDVAGMLSGHDEPVLGVHTASAVSDAIRGCPSMTVVLNGQARQARWLVVRGRIARLEADPPTAGVAVLVDMQQVMLTAAEDFGSIDVAELDRNSAAMVELAGEPSAATVQMAGDAV